MRVVGREEPPLRGQSRSAGTQASREGVPTACSDDMDYYYCPSLLKLLRYLWVSVAGRRGLQLVRLMEEGGGQLGRECRLGGTACNPELGP